MKRTFIIVFYMIMGLLASSSCASDAKLQTTIHSTDTSKAQETAFAMPSGSFESGDDQYCYDKQSTRIISMAGTPEGVYFFSGPGQMFLYYMDKRTGKAVPLCSKPDCLHADEPDPKRVADCSAWFPIESNFSLLYSEPYLYVASYTYGAAGSQICKLVRISKDGTQRKEVFTFKELPDSMMIHRGILYYTTNDNGTQAGNEATTKSKACLYKISLNDLGKTSPKKILESDGIYSYVDSLKAYRDVVYFGVSYYEDAGLQQRVGRIMCMTLDNDTPRTIAENAGLFQFCGDKLMYYWRDKTITECDLNGGNPNKLTVPIADILYSDDTYLVIDSLMHKLTADSKSNEEEPKRKLYFCNLSGKELQEVDIDVVGPDYCYGSDSDFVYLHSKSGENEFGNLYTLWSIDKNEVARGTAGLKTIFTFTPKFEDKGVITRIG